MNRALWFAQSGDVGQPSARRPTRAEVLSYRGHLCNLADPAWPRVIWTPSLPGAPADMRKRWLQKIAANGGTHVPIGPFTPGEAYPGIGIVNPDWTNDHAAIRGLLLEILDTLTQYGHGMVPVVFMDSGGKDPRARLLLFMHEFTRAAYGLWGSILTVPCGWEPVVGDWTSADVSWALRIWHTIEPDALIAYHGSPERLVGSSNPIEPDDPWDGMERDFFFEQGGEHISICLYQLPHGSAIYEPDTCPNAAEPFGHRDGCPWNRLEDYVARIGAGYHGWRKLPIVLFETVAYEAFRGQATNEQARDVATRAKTVFDKWSVPFWWGNGEPR